MQVDDGSVVAGRGILFETVRLLRQRHEHNTVAIVVLGQPSDDESFLIDEQTYDVPFNTAIAWHIDLGTNLTPVPGGDELRIDLSDDQDNTVVVTNTSFDLNGAVGEVLGMEQFFGYGGDGDDVLDASAVTSAVYVDLKATTVTTGSHLGCSPTRPGRLHLRRKR